MEQNDENIGYGRPPRKNQFKKGVSGNPKGRPKASRNFSTLLDQEMEQKVSITENGKRMKISKKQAIAKVLSNKSIAGSDRSIAVLLPQLEKQDEKNEQARASKGAGKILEEDREILKRFGCMGEGDDPESVT